LFSDRITLPPRLVDSVAIVNSAVDSGETEKQPEIIQVA
jgi:hypothetical protein